MSGRTNSLPTQLAKRWVHQYETVSPQGEVDWWEGFNNSTNSKGKLKKNAFRLTFTNNIQAGKIEVTPQHSQSAVPIDLIS